MGERTMNIRVPHLGEGLQEVRILELLKAPGDTVRQGDTLYTVETDKSAMELQAPADGTLEGWQVSVGDVVPVGAVVASFQLIDDESERATEARPATPSGPTRAGTRVEPLSPTQRAFVYRLRRSASMAIPATIAIDIPAISGTELTPPSEKPRPLLTLAWAVAQAVRQHPRFLCTMRNDDSVNVYDYLNLGIAVALPGDELVTAVIPAADRVPREEFASHYKAAIKAAIDGTNRAGYDTQILLTYLGDWQIEAAVPTLVAPANSVIFLGAPRAGSTTTRLTLTFDHRLVNGARAAGLLAQITASTGAHFCRH